jgi:hypothetical protein
MTQIINFADRRGGSIYYCAHIVPEGMKRRRWAVIRRAPDGTEEIVGLNRRESDARGMVSLWRKAEAKRQRERDAFVANPFGRGLASMPSEALEFMRLGAPIQERRIKGLFQHCRSPVGHRPAGFSCLP